MMSIVVGPVVTVGIIMGHIGVGSARSGNIGSGVAGRQTIKGGGLGVPTETDGQLSPLVRLGSQVRVGLGVIEDGTTGIRAKMSLLSGGGHLADGDATSDLLGGGGSAADVRSLMV